MQVGLGFWASKTLLSAVELGVFSTLADAPADPTISGLTPVADPNQPSALVSDVPIADSCSAANHSIDSRSLIAAPAVGFDLESMLYARY